MSFGIPAGPQNRALASVIGDRIKSEASMVAARASFWRLLGFGSFCLLIGAGVGLAFFGYSYVTDGHRAMAQLTDAITNSLNNVVFKVEPVKLDPNSTVKLDPDATVRLDTTDATVRLDTTGTTVRLDTTGGARVADSRDNVPRPTELQLNPPSQLNPPVSQQDPTGPQARVVTNFTVFKTVKMPPGEVITGWKYDSSANLRPVNQYCYYRLSSSDTVSSRYDLAVDSIAVPVEHNVPFDFDRALANCVWFSGRT